MADVETFVRRLMDEHVSRHAEIRSFYLDDAQFHMAVEIARVTLTAVAEALNAEGAPPRNVESVLRGALDRLVNDVLKARTEAEVLVREANRG